MMHLRRSIYLLYYIKETRFQKLCIFLTYASAITGKSRARLLADAVCSVYRFNISLIDYFYFRFYVLNEIERKKWAGTGYMYEYQLLMNPKVAREVLENKIRFLNHFRPYVKRVFASLSELKSNHQIAEKMLENSSGRLALKGSRGQVGAEIEMIQCEHFTPITLIEHMIKMNFDLAEEYVVQHPLLMKLSPSGLNTLRIFTQLNENSVDFLGARLRISVNSPVDNMAAGNLAAPVDLQKGQVNGPAVYSDITKSDCLNHPLTGESINGFLIPFWKEVLDLARRAALCIPDNRSVGWDIAITVDGPELIEGNHNWCKLLWQLPVKQGLKSELEKYL